MILLGTSGFSFTDWSSFYPAGLRRQDFLTYYSRFFRAVELNFTYYAMPTAQKMAALARQVPAGFLFTVKGHSSLTHSRMDLGQACRDFHKGIEPLEEKLGCVLLQFPWNFRYSQANLAYLAQLSQNLGGLPAAVEFRHNSWLRPDVDAVLRQNGLGFCAVDEPQLEGLLPPVAKITGKIAYLRFHGRNREKWWRSRNSSERYDYLYSDDELSAWLPKIAKMKARSERTFIFFNNCHLGQAAQNAQQMQKLLGQNPPDPVPRQGSLF